MEELKVLLQIIGQGGTSIIIFIIWYFTFKQGMKETQKTLEKHAELNETLIDLLKDEQEYKTHLAGVLTRLEVKLSAPLQCPLTKNPKERLV